MEDVAFQSALSFALHGLGCPNLSLKAEQREAVWQVYSGKDVFVWLPTGYGKSLCYEVLPWLLERKRGLQYGVGLVLVVSPLVSLMISQAQSLRRRGVRAAILSTAASKVEKSLLATEEDLLTCRLLFGAPEAIVCSSWREELQRAEIGGRIVAVAIDEAHCVSKWSSEFRPSYGRLHEIRSLLAKGTPFLACTATVTRSIRQQVIRSLEMFDCAFVFASPDRPNIFYEVHQRSDIAIDMLPVLTSLKENKRSSPRVIVYCRSLDMCANLYSHFLFELGEESYYPVGAEKLSKNRLFDMYHACSPANNKETILQSLAEPDGVLRVVFATVALGMGIDLKDVNTIIHYGAPHTLDDFFQESGRGGRSGQAARSIVYWKPIDCPHRKQLSSDRDHEIDAVRRYLDNSAMCRRRWLLHYFDSSFISTVTDPKACCDICAKIP